MSIDLRPRFQAPSVDDFSRGPSPLVAFLQNLQGGYQQGKQMRDDSEEKKRRKEAVGQILSTHPELQGFVSIDNVHEIMPSLIKSEFDKKTAGPMRNLYRDPKSGLFGDQAINGQQPYPVSTQEAVNTLSGQNKQDSLQARLDEMINARKDSDKIRSDNMAKNRVARLIIAQYGRNFKADKANMDNVIKSAAGLGFNLDQEDVLKAYQDTTGETVTPRKSGKVKVSNFSVTP